MSSAEPQKEDECYYKKACYLIAVIIVFLIILFYMGYFKVVLPETLTDTQITNSLIAATLARDPQNSAALFRQMTPEQRAKYENLVPLPFDPNYYRPA